MKIDHTEHWTLTVTHRELKILNNGLILLLEEIDGMEPYAEVSEIQSLLDDEIYRSR